MKLDRVEIKNFRSIKEIALDFSHPCRVLVGINESGKSNILNALTLLKKEYNPQKNRDLREALPDEETVTEAYVQFIFKLETKELNKLFELVSEKVIANKKNPDIASQKGKKQSIKDLCYKQNEVVYEVNILEENKSSFGYYALSDEYNLLGKWKKPTNTCPQDFNIEVEGQQYNLLEHKFLQVSNFNEIPDDYLEEADIKSLEELIDESVSKILEENIPDVLFWNYSEENLLPDIINIDDFIRNPDSYIPLKNMFTLARVEDIQHSLQEKRRGTSNQFQNYLNSIAKKTTNHFRKVWKDYKNIEFSLKVNANQIVPGIKEKNTYDFARRSDGFKRFVTFLLLISVRVKTNELMNTLLLVDEADISLHPSGARYLRDELIKISNKNYIVYSTHSIFMINSGNIGQHYIVKKEDEITTINQAIDSNIVDEEVLYNALGFSVFEILKEKNIIFEGWRDKHLFQVYIQKLPKKELKAVCKDIGVCHAKGVPTIKTITPMIELAKRKCLILSDSDQIAIRSQESYQKERNFGDWKTYKNIDPTIEASTGEDFIKNDCIVKNVNKVLSIMEKALIFDESFLKKKVDKLKQIRSWLQTNNILGEEQEDIIKKTKNFIFENLKNENIDKEYEKLFKGISSYFLEN